MTDLTETDHRTHYYLALNVEGVDIPITEWEDLTDEQREVFRLVNQEHCRMVKSYYDVLKKKPCK